MTFFKYSRLADSFSRSWFLSILKENKWIKIQINDGSYGIYIVNERAVI